MYVYVHKLVNIILKMAELCLAFRGHNEIANDGICICGNFLGLVAMQAEFDPVLKQLINRPKGDTKYLSPAIQNELISLLALQLRKNLGVPIFRCNIRYYK